MRRFLLLLAFLLLPRLAFADEPPVYVVDVKGLDPARTRAAIGRELGAEAIAPDDARASRAAGLLTVEANASDGSLVVRFQKHESPVERSTRLPGDPARAEATAVLLAGNLARDDAKALLDALTPPAQKETKAAAAIASARDAEDLRILRLTLLSKSEQETRQSRALLAGTLLLGAIELGGGITLATAGRTSYSRGSGDVLIGMGTWTFCVLFGSLFDTSPTFADVAKKLEAASMKGDSSADALVRVDQEWEQHATRARLGRLGNGMLKVGAAVLTAGLGTYLSVRSNADYQNAALLFGASAVAMSSGIYQLVMKTTIEEEYAAWRKVRALPEPEARLEPRFGVSPLPGGAAATFGFAF